MCRKLWISLLCLVLLGGAASVRAQSRPRVPPRELPKSADVGVYDRLDLGALTDELSAMHMTELLNALDQQIQDVNTVSGLWGRSKVKIARALLQAEDLELRRELLDDAAKTLQQLIDRTSKVADDDWQGIIDNLKYRYTLIDVLGRLQCGLRAEALMMLMGGEDDRKVIQEYTQRVAGQRTDKEGKPIISTMLDDVKEDIDRALQKVRKNAVIQVQFEPALESLQDRLRWSSAWIQLYRGLVVKDLGSRRKSLEDAIVAADRYAKGETEDGVKDPASLLLQGVASTEIALSWREGAPAAIPAGNVARAAALASADKEFGNAAAYFKSGMECEAIEAPQKIQLNYQIARNLIEWGKYDEALKTVNGYTPLIVSLLGKDAAIQGEVNTALLMNYLYLTWADNTADKAQADAYRLKSQDALLDFIKSHKPKEEDQAKVKADKEMIVQAFYKIIANKYRSVAKTTPEVLSPMVLFCVAVDEYNLAMTDAHYEKDMNKLKGLLKNNEHLKLTDKLLNMVIASKSPEAAAVQGDAKTLSGMVKNILGMGEEAADASLASGTRDGVMNACIIYKEVLDSKRTMDETATRLKLIKALEKLLGNPEWVKDPKVVVWYVDLGQQCAIVAKGETDLKKKLEFIKKSVDAFLHVPKTNNKMFMASQHMALSQQYEQLRTMQATNAEPNELNRLATDFAKGLREYSGLVESTIKEASAKTSEDDKTFVQDLTVWGADSDYLLAIIMYEQLGLKDDSLQILSKLAGKWPTAKDVLIQATEFKINKHMDAGDIDKAVEEINKFRTEHPEQASVMMRSVIDGLRNQIGKLKRKESTPDVVAKLAKARKDYVDFAKVLKDKMANAPVAAKYPYDQMYADALIENGKAAEALKAFEELTKARQDMRKAEEKANNDFVDKLLADADKVKDNAAKLIEIGDKFAEVVKSKGMVPENKGYVQKLKISVDYAKRGDPAKVEDMQYRIQQMADNLRGACAALRKELNADIPDSVNLYGLARCHQALKKYNEAITEYKILESMGNALGAQAGQVRLELTQCLFESHIANPDVAKRKEQMGILLLTIKRYREMDPKVWGYVDDFNRIEADAKTVVNSPDGKLPSRH